MVDIKINARVRPSTSASYKHGLRDKGKIPAVIYGKGINSEAIEIDARELETAIKKRGRNALMNMVVKDTKGENKYVVMVKDIQRNPIGRELVHADLCKISLKDKIHTSVPLSFQGEPVGIKNGGILQTGTREVEVECMPTGVPETVFVDISLLDVGSHFTVDDLAEASDYRVITDPETVIVTILAPRKTEEPAATPAAGVTVADTGAKPENGE